MAWGGLELLFVVCTKTDIQVSFGVYELLTEIVSSFALTIIFRFISNHRFRDIVAPRDN